MRSFRSRISSVFFSLCRSACDQVCCRYADPCCAGLSAPDRRTCGYGALPDRRVFFCTVQGSGRFSEFFERLPVSGALKPGRQSEDVFERAELENHVIVVGFGLNGRNVSRVLSASGIPFVVLEMNPETVRIEKKHGVPVLYGDASNETVLEHVNIKTARSVVIAISDASATRRIVELARRLNSSVYIIARTRYTNEVNPLYSLGANDVIPEDREPHLRGQEKRL